MHGLDLIATLAGGLTAALVFGLLTQRLGLSPIVGYLLGGILVGPHTPGFVADVGLAQQLAEIGVVLLMFGVGLQFHVDELLSVRHIAVPGAVAQSVVATLLGAVVGRTFGWGWSESVVFGIALSVASTVVLVRVLADNRELHTPTGHIAVGWLVVEDLFTVLVLVVLPAVAGGGASAGELAGALAWTLVKVGSFVAVTMFVGTRAIPWLLDRVAATHARDLFTLTVLVLALGIAFAAASVFGVSMALGAFLAGLVVGRSEFSLRAASEALPMRDAFAVLFFVSVGMLLNPQALVTEPWLVIAALAVVIVGKPLVALLVVLLLRRPVREALAVSIALAQIGEFSFILAALGVELQVATPQTLNVIVAVSIVSIILNPLLYRAIVRIEPALSRFIRVGRAAELSDTTPRHRPLDAAHRALVIGYGPTGQTLVRLLRENTIEPTIVEFNMDTVRRLRDQGIEAVYGDASQRETLVAAGAETAGNLILSADVGANAEQIIRVAREMNPRVHVVARTTHLRGVPALRAAGAEAVFSGEGEVALALAEAVLHRLGATPDQIDRERERVRAELLV